ncbi:TPA: bifunctional glutamate N-acetyltransferase/amino-acid acetyltransferase ArgJ [Candidatus Poribacteria bacterium]|nr:bifunctional glutamate N-acetyltransferase/amino-acid acetyltransferase ArgJ [Candidatus Poribacteria bacterium]
MKEIEGGITSVPGFRSAGVACGIKTTGAKDLAVIVCDDVAVSAGTFTSNKVKSAPVLVSMERIKSGKAKAIVANSGNANACTGEQGIKDAKRMTELVASGLNISPELVLVASTGKIGRKMPMDKIENGIKLALSGLSYTGGHDSAEAIMTTDTFSKEIAVEFDIQKKKAHIGGMVKGAGMINPNMATMLCFLTTDVCIEQSFLQKALKSAVDVSFNMISVDGDTSTNDTVLILANGKAGNSPINRLDSSYEVFLRALTYVTTSLAKMIAKDGEGATKFIELRVRGAKTEQDARKACHTIARSPLLKCALFGEDPNWGRIMSSLGISDIDMDQNKVDIWFDDLKIAQNGISTGFSEESAKDILKKKEYVITIDLKMGNAKATLWTCDLSYDYVKINIV